MLIESLNHIFNFKWEILATASWMKYPCIERPDIISVDILDKKFDLETGILTSKRLIVSKSKLPGWLSKLFGSSFSYFYEESSIDPIKKIMTLQSRNISFTNIIQVAELCVYRSCPHDSTKTIMTQEMAVRASPFGLAGAIEKYSTTKFIENANYGRKIMERAINYVISQQQKSLIPLPPTRD
eukprot:TRINITY_DN1615_c1_g1_i1.p1 TRINITY_DN1615_c1_g1~~TRINITY_DN1615_c1_g1_i1.p1  ORF type:complete len:183 (+),score=61.63 TRINITY_DN1615_c1_g1_i1:22-570(+)